MSRISRTQETLDEALKSGETIPVLVGDAWFQVKGSARVEAWGSAHVVAWESAHVEAWGSAQIKASQYVAVHQHSETARIAGGTLIKIPTSMTVLEWCAFYGAKVQGDLAILYKAVDDDYRSPHGMLYMPGTMPTAPDWDGGREECGGGLHFTATPVRAQVEFHPQATRFVACPVALADIIVHRNALYPFKVKVLRVAAPIFEVDRDGQPLGDKVKISTAR